MSFSVRLKHKGTGEERTLPVNFVSPAGTYLSVIWPMSGAYDLNLQVNRLTARSAAARRKGNTWDWEAVDIAGVRESVRAYLARLRGNADEAVKEQIARHQKTMPCASGE